ncbi:Holliday junction resolvase RuvX [Flavobacteriales bacterium]|jgi:putative Holliday junction resolvase|nr:Holliday junction resolvase RuvX [Flavobacteriales bacterium]MDB2622284.1 Holliday junction resolvase RuvX [Flavobacteriales bacterium]
MARLLALDYGTKRVGIAITDELQMIASGLCTVRAHDCMDYLKDYISKESVSAIVLGLPKDLNNQKTDSTPYVKGFAKQLRKAFPELEVHYVDERFTSKMAFQSMIDGGLKKKARQNKALVDEVSATLILQSFMEQRNFKI